VSALPVARFAPGPAVTDAYHYCEKITRRSGSSFAAAFWMLPKPKRRAIHAIYAFCRLADDFADDPGFAGNRTALLKRWRGELDDAYLGKAEHPVGIALSDAVHRYRLPEPIFVDLLAGVESDLAGDRFGCFEDLRLYCYRVASTVGLQVVRVLGYRNPKSLDYAETLGIAVQLTNVLRDVGLDASAGRVYLPRDELDRFGVSTEDLRRGRMTNELRHLLDFYAERVDRYYERAEELLPSEDRRSLLPAVAMGQIYRALFEELRRKDFPCFDTPLRLPKSRRFAIAAMVWLGVK
jgi:phytoene synthase